MTTSSCSLLSHSQAWSATPDFHSPRSRISPPTTSSAYLYSPTSLHPTIYLDFFPTAPSFFPRVLFTIPISTHTSSPATKPFWSHRIPRRFPPRFVQLRLIFTGYLFRTLDGNEVLINESGQSPKEYIDFSIPRPPPPLTTPGKRKERPAINRDIPRFCDRISRRCA